MPGEVVGEVSIKDRPDTTKFSQELRAQLKKINDDFQVDVGLNTKGALAEFKTLKQQIERDTIEANVKLDTRSLSRAAGFRAPLAGVGNVFKQIAKSLDAASRSSQRMARQLIAIRQSTAAFVGQTLTWIAQMARLAVSVETVRKAWDGLSRSIQAVTRRAKDLSILSRLLASVLLTAGKFHGARMLQFAKSLGQVSTYTNAARKAMAALNSATDRVAIGLYRIRNIRLTDVVNGIKGIAAHARNAGRSMLNLGKNAASGIGRLVDSGIKGVGQLFSKAFSGMASMASSVGESLAGMSRNMILVAAVAAVVAPLMGLISGLLAGLPSLLAVAGAGFAAIALGMDGIKAAAQTLKPQVDALKAALSERWQSGLTPIFEQLKAVFPVLQEGLLAVTDGLLSMAQGFTNVVTSAAGLEYIRTILAGVGQFFSGITPMVSNLTHSFLQLAAAGAQNFGFLIDVLNRFGASFADMTARITGSTAFADAMRGMAQVLDAVLQGFVRVMEAGVIAMGQLGGPLATFINGFTDAFVGLMPILSAVSGLLFDVLGTALSALGPVFTALAPAIQQIANLLGPILTAAIQALVPILTPLAQFLGTVLTTAINALMPLVQPLVGLFGQLGQMLGGIMMQAASALTPLITILGQALGQIVAAVAPLLPAFGQLAMAIIPPLVGILLQLMPVITQLAQAVLPILVQVIQAAIPVVMMIAQAFAQILPPIIAFVSQILGAVIPVVTSLLGVIQSVFPQIQGIINGVMNVIKGIINVVLGVITGDWTRAWNGLKQILQGAWQAISSAVQGGINLVLGLVRSLPGAILGAIGNLGSLLFNAGRSLLIGLWNGISSMVGWVIGQVKGVVQSIRNFFPFSPAKTGPFSGKGYTTYSGRALIKDWAKGIEDEAPTAIRAVEDMMNATQKVASAEFNGHISSDGFGSVADRVAEALTGWSVEMDANGLTRMVNRTNKLNQRRIR
jgi:phage-related protein